MFDMIPAPVYWSRLYRSTVVLTVVTISYGLLRSIVFSTTGSPPHRCVGVYVILEGSFFKN